MTDTPEPTPTEYEFYTKRWTHEKHRSLFTRPHTEDAFNKHTLPEHPALDKLVTIDFGIQDLKSMLKAWKASAETTMSFIQEHIAIIGEKEIKGYAVVKKAYQKAVEVEKWVTDHGRK